MCEDCFSTSEPGWLEGMWGKECLRLETLSDADVRSTVARAFGLTPGFSPYSLDVEDPNHAVPLTYKLVRMVSDMKRPGDPIVLRLREVVVPANRVLMVATTVLACVAPILAVRWRNVASSFVSSFTCFIRVLFLPLCSRRSPPRPRECR